MPRLGEKRKAARHFGWMWIVIAVSASGCSAPQTRTPDGLPDSISAGTAARANPSLVETWVVHTRACEQEMGSDPWASIAIARFDGPDQSLAGTAPEALLERMSGRTSVFLIHGYGYSYRNAVDEAVQVRALLEEAGGLPPESLLIVYDWPSQRELPGVYADLNEKSKRARIAAYHLARFLQEAPAGARVCLVGQSDGGRVSLTTLHLLSGAVLPAICGEPAGQLSAGRPDLRCRCVIVDAAAGHHWLNPGERLDHVLPYCDAFYNIYNSGDVVLMLFILGRFTGFRPAIGRVGLTSHDMKALGALSAKVEQIDLHSRVGFSHTSVAQALGFPDVAARIGQYTSWGDFGSKTE
jgi:hypothetical protein